MDLLGAMIEDGRRKIKMTVLHRPHGAWHQVEINRFANGLMTEVSSHPEHPQYLVLFGHHTKESTLKAPMGGMAYTATQITGVDSKELPFIPGFA